MDDDKRILTGHFISHWGIPKKIRPIAVSGIDEFAVLEFGPRGVRETWRYATNGMSSYAQCHPDSDVNVRTELYGCTNEKAAWVADLLAAMASYPLDYSTYLAEGDTIDVGQPIDRNGSCFTGVLLVRPGVCDPSSVGLVGGIRDDVLVHQVVGLLPVELEFANRHGELAILEHLVQRGGVALDVVRGPVV